MNKPHVKPPPGLAFDDDGALVRMTDFDWAAIYRVQEEVGPGPITELFDRIRNEEKILARAETFVKLLLEILKDNPSEKQAGRRLYVAAHRMGLLGTRTDSDLAHAIGTTPDAIKKAVKALYSKGYESTSAEENPADLAPPDPS